MNEIEKIIKYMKTVLDLLDQVRQYIPASKPQQIILQINVKLHGMGMPSMRPFQSKPIYEIIRKGITDRHIIIEEYFPFLKNVPGIYKTLTYDEYIETVVAVIRAERFNCATVKILMAKIHKALKEIDAPSIPREGYKIISDIWKLNTTNTKKLTKMCEFLRPKNEFQKQSEFKFDTVVEEKKLFVMEQKNIESGNFESDIFIPKYKVIFNKAIKKQFIRCKHRHHICPSR